MRQALQKHKLPKIFIFGNKHTVFFKGERQHRLIRGVGHTLANRHDIAVSIFQDFQNGL